jgi:hypothetical protein
MQRPSGAQMLAIGLAAGVLLGPGAAQAATSLVGIVGSTGTRAAVAPTGRLLTSEAAPSQFRGFHAYASSGACTVFATVPAANGYVIRQIVFDTYDDPSPGSASAIQIYIGSCLTFPIASVHPEAVGSSQVDFNPGQALKAGTTLYYLNTSGAHAVVWVRGYTVAPTAVAANSPY